MAKSKSSGKKDGNHRKETKEERKARLESTQEAREVSEDTLETFGHKVSTAISLFSL
jgi:hypothetical protein